MIAEVIKKSENKSGSSSKKQILSLSALRMLRLTMALLNMALSAKYFGATLDRDLWLLSFTTINVVQNVFWGPINETFRAKFIFIREDEGEPAAMLKTSSLLTFTAMLTLLILLILVVFREPVTKLIAPGNAPAELLQLGNMLMILAPSLLLLQVSVLLTSILNAYDIFSFPEIAASLTYVLSILTLVIFVPYFGIYALALSYYLSTIILLVILIHEIRKNKIPLYASSFLFKFIHVKPFILFSLPFFAAYVFSQINSLTEKSIASIIGHGSISIIDYSRKFIDIPLQVFYSVLGTMMIPNLSKKFKTDDLDGFRAEFMTMLKLGLLFFGLFLGLLILGAGDITDIIYNRGKMDSRSLKYISELAVYYGFGALAIFCFSILGFSLIARDHVKPYAICASLAHVIITLINFLFFQQVGIYLFPISLFGCYAMVTFIMIINFQKHVGGLCNTLITYGQFISIISLLSYLAREYVFQSENYFPPVVQLSIKSILLLALAIILIFVSKMEEKKIILDNLKKIKSLLIT